VRWFCSVSAITVLAIFCPLAAAQNLRPPGGRRPGGPAAQPTPQILEGVRLFHTHCGRCHNPPEDLSPREARAVVRQMRLRAILSDQDERALLKLLAP
jgi:cytochrome c5